MLKIGQSPESHYTPIYENIIINSKDFLDNENKRFGLYPRNNTKLKKAFSFKEGQDISDYDDSACDTTYLSEDILKYLYMEKIINGRYLVFLSVYNENIGIKFLYWIIDNVKNKNVLDNFDCELMRTNGYEQIYNFEMKYPNLIGKGFYFMRPKNLREKQFYMKLLSMNYRFIDPRCQDRFQSDKYIIKNCNTIYEYILLFKN